MRRKVKENTRMPVSGLSGHGEHMFSSRIGLFKAKIVSSLLNGLARQAGSYICYFPSLLKEHFHFLSDSDGKLASVTFC